MAYDEFGNYTGDYNTDTSTDVSPVDPYEEERKRREEELLRQEREAGYTPPPAQQPTGGFGQAVNQLWDQRVKGLNDRYNAVTNMVNNPEQALRERVGLTPVAEQPKPVKASAPADTVAHKREITTYGDGSQTVKTTQEIPAGGVSGGEAPNQEPGPKSFVDLSNSQGPRVAYEPAQAQPVAPQTQIQAQPLPPAGAPGYGINVGQPGAQPVVAGPAYPTAGAGRGYVNPPTVNQPVEPQLGEGGQPGQPLVNNNPGNIMFGPYAKQMGATGARPNGTAIFPDQATGENAQHNLLSSKGYSAYSIKDIPQRWAPAGHGNNDPVAYGNSLQKFTGFSDETMGKSYNDLTPEEQKTYRQAMQRIEHGTASSGVTPSPAISQFQNEVNNRAPGSLGNFGPNGDGVDGIMGANTQAAIAANPDLAQKYGLTSSAGTVEQNQTPAQRGITAYDAAQKDPAALLKLANDENMPKFIQDRSRQQAYDLLHQDRQVAKANEKIDTMVANGDQTGIAKVLATKAKTEEGSYLKAYLFARLGLNDLAKEEQQKLGAGSVWKPMMNSQGEMGLVKFDGNGVPIQGVTANNETMDDKQLMAFATQGGAKATDISGTQKQALVNGELHTFSTKRTPNGTMYRDDTAGTGWTTQAPTGLTHLGQQDPGHLKGLTAANAVVTKMSKANADSVAATGRPLYSQQQIQQARNDAYTSVSGRPFGGAGFAPANAEGTVSAPVTPNAPVANAPAAPQAPANAPKTLAQQILDYEAPFPTGPTSPTKLALQQEVNRLAAEQGKTYDAGQYKIANKTRQDFLTGTQGKAVQSMNVAIDHLDTLQQAANALNNGSLPLFNDIAQKYAKNTGSPAPTNFDALKSIVGSEVAKAVTGGASALGDREEIRAEINKANSPQQLAGVINKYQQLMSGQVKGLKKTYESAGLKGFDDKLLPRTKYILNKTEEPTRSNW